MFLSIAFTLSTFENLIAHNRVARHSAPPCTYTRCKRNQEIPVRNWVPHPLPRCYFPETSGSVMAAKGGLYLGFKSRNKFQTLFHTNAVEPALSEVEVEPFCRRERSGLPRRAVFASWGGKREPAGEIPSAAEGVTARNSLAQVREPWVSMIKTRSPRRATHNPRFAACWASVLLTLSHATRHLEPKHLIHSVPSMPIALR
jgi:hypothetical protein